MRKISLHWTLHPEKDNDWYEGECKRMTEDEVARELDINYRNSISGRVFTSFNENRHTSTKPMPFNRDLPVYRIWDFGATNCVIYGQIDPFGRRRVLHERVLKSTFTEQIQAALRDSWRYFKGAQFIDICDPSGSYDDGKGMDTYVSILEKPPAEGGYGLRMHYQDIIAIPTKDRKRMARRMLELDLERAPGGKEAFMVYSDPDAGKGCVLLTSAMLGGYCYKTDQSGNFTDVIREVHPYEDVIDCLLYWYLETKDAVDEWTTTHQAYSRSSQLDPFTGYRRAK